MSLQPPDGSVQCQGSKGVSMGGFSAPEEKVFAIGEENAVIPQGRSDRAAGPE